jgi:regulator of protease activity HflC (stomatin/prohibitin superfamily)
VLECNYRNDRRRLEIPGMLSPLSLDLAAQEIVRERVQQAAREALVSQFRASVSDARRAASAVSEARRAAAASDVRRLAAASDVRSASARDGRFAWPRTLTSALGLRQRVADALRLLAYRLDPTVACCDPPLAVLKAR